MNRSLAVFALLALAFAPARGAEDVDSSVAPKANAAPPVILVLRLTYRGQKQRVLENLGISRFPNTSKSLVENLERALDRTDIYGPFLAPTVCPGARVDDACPAVRMIDDVKLPEAIAALQTSRIVLVRPYLAYFEKHEYFSASFAVDLLGENGRRENTFAVAYYDWRCDVACVQTSYPAAAVELAAMFRHVLEVDIGFRTKAVPAAWREKSRLKDFAPWSNRCTQDTDNYRIVRKYGERLWLNPSSFLNPDIVALVSLSWRGCNIFDVL